MAQEKRQRKSPAKTLSGRVALVAGATRGAGRGIARALADAGAIVYCTGRSVAGKRSDYKRPETVNETAAFIRTAGGTAFCVRVDHTIEREVAALCRRILRKHKRLDIVVDSVAGEDPLMKQHGALWETDLSHADRIFRQGLLSRIITAKHAARAMLPARKGLIVIMTENDIIGAAANSMAHVVKVAQKILPLSWAVELATYGISVVALTPGFLRSESVLDHFAVTEETWREAGSKDPNFLASESPLFVGRAVASLAADPAILQRTGMLFSSWELAWDYGFTDYDGRRPDWGRHPIDFTVLPAAWTRYIRTSTSLELKWLTKLATRARNFRAKIPS
ncbi:MAG TPA: SDR family NAD(P)-dependent oxidoreductase [Steroidobacteraceae bacterium]|jgi:NAD(P)-dependent dehydrogenase (short-subunit alcohol dehydrogenase family)|nr:SDR family NAD(P)-dependent oxidoreductase [Steroidobacteraceae bacterium]